MLVLLSIEIPFLFRHLELAIVLFAIGQGEVDHVAPGVVEISDVAVGGPQIPVIHRSAGGIGDLYLDLPEVLCENHRERVAVDGGLDGRAFVQASIGGVFNYNNGGFPFVFFHVSCSGHVVCIAKCRREN